MFGIIVAGMLFRVVATLIVGTNVAQYEFGTIAANLNAGRGYSYFGVDEYGNIAPATTGTGLPSAFMPPLYTMIVALAQSISGNGELGIRILQGINVLLAASLISGFYWLVRLISGNRAAAAIAGLLVALYPPLIYSSTQISASNLYIPLEILLIGLMIAAAKRLTRINSVLIGVGVGALTLLRADAVILIPMIAAWLLRYAPNQSRRCRMLNVGCVVLIGSLLPLGWMVSSSHRLGAPIHSIATTAGFNLWIGNHAGASGSQKRVSIAPEGTLAEQGVERAIGRLPGTQDYEIRRDAIYLTEALHYIKQEPAATLERDVKKICLMLIGDWCDPRSSSLVVGLNLALIIGGILSLRRIRLGRGEAVLLIGYASSTILVSSIFFALERYALPLRLILIMFIAMQIADNLSRGRKLAPN